MICEREINHGDHKLREIQRGRVQRDRRPSVIGVAGRRIRCRRRDVSSFRGVSVWDLHRERGDTALDYVLKAEHEARLAEIVSNGRPQWCARHNRIADAKKLAASLQCAPVGVCVGAARAMTLAVGNGEAGARNSQILTRLGGALLRLSADDQKRGTFAASLARSAGIASRLDTLCLPRGGGENRLV